ncbi:MAG: AraC family transcriptional regulator [Candidatus Riflebacteria bacterium]|nr:AraC family transcriptional regulator [Candidatus Riflebacteria bacterium]
MEAMTLESLFSRDINNLLETPHRVNFYHLILFTQGTGVHSVDFIDYTYDSRTLLLISKGQVHQFHVNNANKGIVIVFTSEFLYENATESNLFHSLHVFESALIAPSIQLTGAQKELLQKFSQAIYSEFQQPIDDLSAEILRHLLRVMLLQIARIHEKVLLAQRIAPNYKEFVTFRRFVERDLGKSRKVEYYAGLLDVSTKKLNEILRKILNKTAKEFIEENVILEARRLLTQGDLPIKEVSARLGFSEPTNLVKFFKKHTNTSPAEFRRKIHSSK